MQRGTLPDCGTQAKFPHLPNGYQYLDGGWTEGSGYLNKGIPRLDGGGDSSHDSLFEDYLLTSSETIGDQTTIRNQNDNNGEQHALFLHKPLTPRLPSGQREQLNDAIGGQFDLAQSTGLGVGGLLIGSVEVAPVEAAAYSFWPIGVAIILTDIALTLDSLLQGRPKLAATQDIATFSGQGVPVFDALAHGALELQIKGIPISSPSASKIYGAYFKQAAIELQKEYAEIGHPISLFQAARLLASLLHAMGNPGKNTAVINQVRNLYKHYLAVTERQVRSYQHKAKPGKPNIVHIKYGRKRISKHSHA